MGSLGALGRRLVLVWNYSEARIHDPVRGIRTKDLQSHERVLSLQTSELASDGINV